MRFKDIFARPVDRHMDGVIKWDEKEYLCSELEEYVVTPEIKKGLQLFCDEYNDPHSDGNGAWVSGFYGSGKSHLLKILSYILENAEVGGRPALDYLKPKIADDPMLLAALEQACERVPSASVLFNIGAKADSGGREDGSALLSAFIKVLNEQCGYFDGAQAYVASFERDLDRAGLYAGFKDGFEAETGKTWEKARKNPLVYAAKISVAYDRVTGNPAGTNTNIIDTYAQHYHPSVEDFADWTAEYVEKQAPDFHLNFFVDEMGQFIANNDELLFSLQNVIELLNTRCSGRVWMVVVSQENVEDIVGTVSNKSSKDFTKIQARFKVKMKIPSNDANTVVKDRLLEKSGKALPEIDRLYEEHRGDFRVLFDFPDGAKHYARYADGEEFEDIYPLVPYQFNLFHKALTGLSDHSCFTGEYTSTGARNMLAATRNVLVARKDSGDVERGDLISFDMMFDGLYRELKSEVFEAVSTAEDHLDDPLGVRILKVLLLVKYNDEFRATSQNLRVLLYGSLSEDPIALEEEIRETLGNLEAQNYVRRNGDAYEYLTNEEKDVEAEIKKCNVDDADIDAEIAKLLAQDIVGTAKTRYMNDGFSETYSYDLMVDGQLHGSRKNDLSLDVLTDLSDNARVGYVLRSGIRQLICALPSDPSLISEMRVYLQTNRYIAQNMRGDDERSRILSEKKSVNARRWQELKAKLTDLINGASWAVCNADITGEVRGSGAERVSSAASIMVRKSYTLLSMLRTVFDTKSIYRAATDTALMEGESLPEYCTETLEEIGRVLQMSEVCFVGGAGANSLEKRLGTGDHGWPATAVRQAVGTLARNGLVECMRSDQVAEGANLAKDLSEGKALDTLQVKPTRRISTEQTEALKRAYRTITGMTATPNDPRQIVEKLMDSLGNRIDEYAGAAAKAHGLPFSARYEERLATLRKTTSHNRDWFVENAAQQAEGISSICSDLHDMAEFANGEGGTRLAEAAMFLGSQAGNIAACPDATDLVVQLRGILADVEGYHDNAAPRANAMRRQIEEIITERIGVARSSAAEDLAAFEGAFRGGNEYRDADEGARSAVDVLFESERRRIAGESQIQLLETAAERFKKAHAAELYALVRPTPALQPDGEMPPETPVKTVMYGSISVPHGFGGETIDDEGAVESFVTALRAEMLEHVRSGEKIIL